jgi:hypothetical protein
MVRIRVNYDWSLVFDKQETYLISVSTSHIVVQYFDSVLGLHRNLVVSHSTRQPHSWTSRSVGELQYPLPEVSLHTSITTIWR